MASRIVRRVLFIITVVILVGTMVVITKRNPGKPTNLYDAFLDPTFYHAAPARLPPPHPVLPSDIDPCTVINPLNHGFIDLRSLSADGNEGKHLSWTAKGYESGHNYTLGICSSPFKQSHDNINELQDSVNSTLVGGYYIDSKTGKYVSIGQFSQKPQFKGRKLTLTYDNGSYCDLLVDSKTGERLRKSTILTFTCDREIMAKAHILYIGSINNCNYVFEVRSHHACPTAAKADNLAAVWIFMIIFLAAIGVYFLGNVLYRQMKKRLKF